MGSITCRQAGAVEKRCPALGSTHTTTASEYETKNEKLETDDAGTASAGPAKIQSLQQPATGSTPATAPRPGTVQKPAAGSTPATPQALAKYAVGKAEASSKKIQPAKRVDETEIPQHVSRATQEIPQQDAQRHPQTTPTNAKTHAQAPESVNIRTHGPVFINPPELVLRPTAIDHRQPATLREIYWIVLTKTLHYQYLYLCL